MVEGSDARTRPAGPGRAAAAEGAARPGTAYANASDEALLGAARGEGPSAQAAFSEFAGRFEPRLRAHAHRLMADRRLHDELVQDTLTKVWRSIERFDPERGSASAFVFTVARTVAIDLWRRPAHRLESAAEDGVEDQAPPATDRVEPLLTGLVVRRALNDLSPSHREVLELGYFGQLTQVEIADRLGVPVGTVKTRTFHALRALRQALDGAVSA